MEKVVGLTKDAGFEIGVSRTIRHPLEAVWAFVTSAKGAKIWLGAAVPRERGATYQTPDGTRGEVRSFHENERVRLTWRPASWDHDSIVQVAVSSTKTGTVLRFHQERLADAGERSAQRAQWQAVMDQVEAALSKAGRPRTSR